MKNKNVQNGKVYSQISHYKKGAVKLRSSTEDGATQNPMKAIMPALESQEYTVALNQIQYEK